MRTISGALTTQQEASSNTPYLKLKFFNWDGTNSFDYTDRCISLEHRESLFREDAVITLYNSDRVVEDITGMWVSIGYGYITGNNVAEPDGNASTAEYSYAPRLWVRHQQNVSAEGVCISVLELTGVWGVIRDTIITLGTQVNSATGLIYNAIYNEGVDTYAVWAIIDLIIDNVSRDATHPIGTEWSVPQMDTLIQAVYPQYFNINREPFEFASDVIYDLLRMTACYLIPKHWDTGVRPPVPATTFPYLACRYPLETDTIELDLYDTKAPWFYEFEHRFNVVVPNHMYVYCNKGGDGLGDEWLEPVMVGEAELPEQKLKFMEMPGYELAPAVTDQSQCTAIAGALLSKVPIEGQSGRVFAPHHPGIELLDRVKVHDSRGYN